jgi:hypothetical protein
VFPVVLSKRVFNLFHFQPITKAGTDSKECAMERQKMKEIISVLMESALYFDFSPQERLEIVKGIVLRVCK